MKKNSRLENRRKRVPEDIKLFVETSFKIADKISVYLDQLGLDQKDLAKLMGKSESEISKWLTGSHNFTIKTLTKIESVLQKRILFTEQVKVTSPNLYETMYRDLVLIIKGANRHIITDSYNSTHEVILSNKGGQGFLKNKIYLQ